MFTNNPLLGQHIGPLQLNTPSRNGGVGLAYTSQDSSDNNNKNITNMSFAENSMNSSLISPYARQINNSKGGGNNSGIYYSKDLKRFIFPSMNLTKEPSTATKNH